MEFRSLPRVCARLLCATSLLFVGSGVAGAAPFVEFETGQVRPLAFSPPDHTKLYAINTPDNRVEIYDVGGPNYLTHTGSVQVGMEPAAVAARNATELWVVNHLSDSVSIVDLSTNPPRVTRTLLVGDEPRDIVFAGPGGNRAFITTAHRGQNNPNDPQLTTPSVGRADVWVFDATDLGASLGGTPMTIITLFADTPRALAVSADGNTVYAAAFHSGNQTTTVTEAAVCNGGAGAPPCVFDGASMPGGLPAPNVNVENRPQPEVGLVVKFNPNTSAWEDELGRNWNNAVKFSLPDKDVFLLDAAANPPVPVAGNAGFYAGVGTVLFNMAVNPVNGKVYVSNTEALNENRFEGPGILAGHTVRGHLHESRISVLAGGSAQARHLNKHINYAVVPGPPSENVKSLAFPLGMAVSSDGVDLWVAAYGSSKIAHYTTAQIEADTFVPDTANQYAVSGGGPSGLLLDESNQCLYVLTRFDNSISVVCPGAGLPSEKAHLPLHNPEPASVVNGRRFLFDASFTSSHGDSACASCHVFGDFDSLAWDLGNPDDTLLNNPGPFVISFPDSPPSLYRNFHPMKGPMTTQSLRGMAGHGPMHWRGDRTGGNDAPSVQPNGGAFNEDAAFKKFNVAFAGLLGRSGPLTSPEIQAFSDYILQVTYPPNPVRMLNNGLTPDQTAGRNFYFGPISDTILNCNGCHTLNPSLGFFGGDGRSTFEGESQHFKVPHLRNLYQKVGMFGFPSVPGGGDTFQGMQVRGFGFLHDGAVDTLFRFHSGAVFQFPLGDPQRRQVEQFMLAFDSNLAPIVGQQITLTNSNSGVAGPRIDLLIARAALNECDLTVKGTVSGQARGWYRTAAGTFRSDRVAEPLLSDGGLTGLRTRANTAGQELTYTCVPPGSGLRVGIDRDEDGFFDRDELDAGSDPADAASQPLGCGNGYLNVGEQCDDGNGISGDGCSAACRFELIPGNVFGSTASDNRACLLEWAVVNPTNTPWADRRGRRNYIQSCSNNNASCDFDLDGSNRTCEFHVVACLNNVDPHLPGCIQQGVVDPVRVILPNATRDPANNTRLVQALQDLRDPVTGATGVTLPIDTPQTGQCTAPFSIRVPLRGTVTRSVAGRGYLRTIEHSFQNSPRTLIDSDGLTLICNP